MPTDQDHYEPAYLALLRSGALAQRVRQAYQRLEMCDLCPRCCRVDRRGIAPGEIAGAGACRTGEQAVVCSYHAHFGEEAPLVGRNGSGTIFFAWCNLNCRYCQNYVISQQGEGRSVKPEELAAMMLQLQDQGCHNVNLVSPSHVVAPILAALLMAAQAGLRLPLIYNTGGYDAVDTLKLLDGVIDIYMPDMKYADAEMGQRFSGVPDYPQVNRAAVSEMHRQVGDLALDERGIARRGLLVRHLVLPEGLAGTAETARFLAQEISRDTYINIMDQYRPCYRAHEYPPLDRPITRREYEEAVRQAKEAGLHRFDGAAPSARRPRLATW
jgi:putative pyruvate formate lyase activating enzyme